MKRLLLLSGSPFRRIVALSLLAAVAPACGGGGGGNPVLPNPGTIGFLQAVFTAAENGGTATITVRRGGGSLGAVSVNYATSSGTATSGTDFTAANGTLTWADGDSADKTFTVTITNDGAVEGDETVGLTLSLPTGGAGLGLFAAILNITDDDAPAAGVVQFNAATYSVNESAGTVTITVTRTGGGTGAASVNWTVSGGSATGGGVDFTATPGTLNWAAGDSSPKTFTIAINDDAVAEAGGETITLALSGATGAVLGSTAATVVTIVDNDTPGTIAFSSAAYTVTESGVAAVITVSRTGGAGGAVGVTFATSDGTATVAGSDYTAANGTLSWAAGDSADKTFTVSVTNDTVVEPNETVNLTLSAPTGGAALGLAAAVLTILDDDCTIQFTNATYNLTEAGGTQTITVSRVGSTLSAVSVDFADAGGGTATGAGTDYTLTAGTLTWAIGDSANKTISIPVVQDTLPEGNETINLALSNVSGVGAQFGAQTTAVATIVDDDVTFQFVSSAINVAEAAGTVSVTARRLGASVGIATVAYSTSDGSATAGSDYTGAGPVTLTWPSGNTTDITFTIPITSDSLAEGNETFNVTLSNPTLSTAGGTAVIVGTNPAVVTIVDDDTNLQFSTAAAAIAEGAAPNTVTINVTRTGLTTGASSVTWSIAGSSTAAAGADYTVAPAAGVLNWAIGDSTPRAITFTIINDGIVEGVETINLVLSSPTGATLGSPNTSTITITDDDFPTISINDVSITEPDAGTANATFTVTLSQAPFATVTVDYATANGSATLADNDYQNTVGTLTFTAGQISKTINVPIVGDTKDELDETFFVNLSNPTNSTILDGQGQGTIVNNDDPTITINDVSTTEGNAGTKTLDFTVTLNHASLQPVTVVYSTADGTATAGSDYVAQTSQVLSIPAGNLTGTISITINGDVADEANETFTVNLSSPTNATILDGTGVGTILNDDDPTITINDVTVVEGTGAGTTNAVFTVTLNHASIDPVSVNFATAGNTAASGVDFTAANSTLNIPAGQLTGTITIVITRDAIDEADETFFVNLSGAVNATIADAQGIGTITDDDGPNITINDISIAEGTGAGTTAFQFTVSLSASSPQNVSVDWTTANGTGVAGVDYTAANGNLLIPSGSTTGTITIQVNKNAVDEVNRTFFINLSNPVNGVITDNQGQATILDDDGPNITINDITVTEGTGAGTKAFTFTVTLSAASVQPVSVDWTTADGTASAPGDYTSASNTLTIPAGSTTGSITVQVVQDSVDEVDETFFVNLSNAVNGTITDNQGQATITDDDFQTISITDVTVTEGTAIGTTTATFDVNLSGVSAKTVTVQYQTADGTATAPADYVAHALTTLTFTPGQTNKQINVSIVRDAIDEANETFTINLSNATNATILDGIGVGTITDDDGPGISINDISVAEGTGAGTTAFTFTVTLTASSPQNVSVNWATADGTAAAPADYAAASGTLVIPAGSTTGNITVQVVKDSTDELNETFFVNLSGPVNATLMDLQGQATIIDDDFPTISITDVTVTEGTGAGTTSAVFDINLSASSLKTVSVQYQTANGTATAPADYTAHPLTTLTYTPGQTNKQVTVLIVQDAIDEANENFFVNLSNPSNATIADAQGVGTITDDDGPDITINDIAIQEGSGGGTTSFQFTVNLSTISPQNVSVNWSTADGTALAGFDYSAASGTVNIPPGSTSAVITVQVFKDSIDEANETFFVNLTGSTNGTITDNQGQATIIDDDGPTISINDVSQVEGDAGTTNFVFTVTLSAMSPQPISVDFTTANGSATAGSDYAATNGTLVIPANTPSGQITVVVNGDTASESNETFFVNLSNPVNATIADNQGVGTILNDDAPSISINDVSIVEGNAGSSGLQFTVSLTNTYVSDIHVDFNTSDGTATSGGGSPDYASTSGTVTILAGQLSAFITVQVNGDNTPEQNETFFVNLTGTDAGTISDNQGVGTIIDDDGPSISINNVTQPEGNGGGTTIFTFTVSLSAVPSTAVSVNWATQDGVATTVDGDYVGANGTLNWNSGDGTPKLISITVNHDDKFEPNETFFVNLSGASGAVVATPQGTGTINNDDAAPSISIADRSLNEGNSGTTPFNFTVSLSNPSYITVSVDYATANGTATTGSGDYQANSGTLIFPPGSTQQDIFVNVNGDTSNEGDETFVVNLTNPVNASISDNQATGTILNDDGPKVETSDPDNQIVNRVINDTNLTLTFNMAMVKTDVETRFSLAPAILGYQFFWDTLPANPNGTIVTVVFDTVTPAGTITGNDMLSDDTVYTWTIAAGAQSATALAMPVQSGQFKTQLDTTPPSVVSITPNPSLAVLNNVTQFVVVFNEPMDTGTSSGKTQVQLKGNGDNRSAQAGTNPPAPLSVVWTNSTTLTIGFNPALNSNAGYRLEIRNLTDANGVFLEDELRYGIVTQGNKLGAPAVTANYPANGATGVTRDTGLFIGTSELLSPNVVTQLSISPPGTPFVVRYDPGEGDGPLGVQVTPKTAWPASTTITVTIPITVTNASLVPFAAPFSFSFTTGTDGEATSSIVIDAPFSSLKDGLNDCPVWSGAEGELLFKDSGTGKRVYLNDSTLNNAAISVTELLTGIPVKGFLVESSSDEPGRGLGIHRRGTSMSPLQQNASYQITFKGTIASSTGTAFSPVVYTFTTVPNSTTRERPMPSLNETRGSTEGNGSPAADRKVELQASIYSGVFSSIESVDAAAGGNTVYHVGGGLPPWVLGLNLTVSGSPQVANNGTFLVVAVDNSAFPALLTLANPAGVAQGGPGGTVTTAPYSVVAADVTGAGNTFSQPLALNSGSGGSQYEYKSTGNEAGFVTADTHTLRVTVGDGVPAHQIQIDTNVYFFPDADINALTLNAPTAGLTPTYSWSAAAPATATAVFVTVEQDLGGGNTATVGAWIVPPNQTSFVHPANAALTAGQNYIWKLGYFHSDGTLRDHGAEGSVGQVSFSR